MTLNILSLTPLPQYIQEKIQDIEPSISLTMVPGWFDGEIRESWPSFTCNRYVSAGSNGKGDKLNRDKLLAKSEIIIVGFPFPLDLKERSPNLKWVHQRPAGASNLLNSDLWNSDVIVTSSRSYAHNLPIAEYTLAGILYFAKGLNNAELDRKQEYFHAHNYNPKQVAGKTVCVVGAGGIGREVGRLCANLGMRVIGTKRKPVGTIEGFAKVCGTDELIMLLRESDFVCICCQWTAETEKMISYEAFDAMKDGAVILNIARGEIIDEDALLWTLNTNKLRGVMLDVYDGEFEHTPNPQLWNDNRVVITPHISAASDINSHRGNDLFVENLKRYLAGKNLENVIDWERGY